MRIGIIIGRFQVHSLHPGHRHLISRTLEEFDDVRLFIGTTKDGRYTHRDPLPYEARKTMLLETFPQLFGKIEPIKDLGHWPNWVKSLDERLDELVKDGDEIFIVGSRDSVATRYKEYLGKHNIFLLEDLPGFSGTDSRKELLETFNPCWNEYSRKIAIWTASSVKETVYNVEEGLDNPFINPINICFKNQTSLIPFHLIKEEHFLPAVKKGIEVVKELHELVFGRTDEPTFENTLGHGYDIYELSPKVDLSLVLNLLSLYCSINLTDNILKIHKEASKLYHEYYNTIRFDDRLYKRLLYVKDHAVDLKPHEIRLLNQQIALGKNQGFDLDNESKKKLCDISLELTNLYRDYDANVTNLSSRSLGVVSELPGVPERVLNNVRNEEGGYNLNLLYTSEILPYCTDQEIRKKLFLSDNSIGFSDDVNNNIESCIKIVNSRLEKANLLGYSSYADYIMSDSRRMLRTVDDVKEFIYSLVDLVRDSAISDIDNLINYAKNAEGNDDLKLMPWDLSYYIRQANQELFNIDPEHLRSYFSFDRVLKGVLYIASGLYSLNFRELTSPSYEENVRIFQVFDELDKFLGTLYIDPFLRENKEPGACFVSLSDQGYLDVSPLDGNLLQPIDVRPIGLIVLDLNPDKSMSFSDVKTLLHEFGHSLHGLLSDVEYSSQSGTRVARDFVEFPSQFMEYFAYEESFLNTYAKNQKGEVLPKRIIQSLKDKLNFMKGYYYISQLYYCLLDLEWSTITTALDINNAKQIILDIEEKVISILGLPDYINDLLFRSRKVSTSFSHIFTGGYSCGYYSYLYSEILSKDAFKFFKKQGNPEVARNLRKYVLSKGDTESPMELYKKFRGQEPEISTVLVENIFTL